MAKSHKLTVEVDELMFRRIDRICKAKHWARNKLLLDLLAVNIPIAEEALNISMADDRLQDLVDDTT